MPKLVKDSGPKSARVVIIGESPGQVEEQRGLPFVGPSGGKLSYWLAKVNLSRPVDCYITNTYPYRPPQNKLDAIPLSEREVWIDKLHDRIAALTNPRILVPMGNYALEALIGKRGILNHRGSIYRYVDRNGRKLKVVPCIHPAMTLYEPAKEAVCMRDWERIAEELKSPKLKRLKRLLHISPTVKDVWDYLGARRADGSPLAVDIETPATFKYVRVKQFKNGNWQTRKERTGKIVACIAFAHSATEAICIPLTTSYWPTKAQRAEVLGYVRELLTLNNPKIFQYGWFDTYCLRRLLGFSVRNWWWDTKDMHHCLTGDARVLFADLTWRRLDSVRVGDELLSFDEEAPRGHRRLRISRVTAVSSKWAPTKCVRFSSGVMLRGTADHKFLVGQRERHGRPNGGVWTELRNMKANDEVWSIGTPWESRDTHDAGWLAGFFDGEGSSSRKLRLSVTQKPGAILNKTRQLLTVFGFANYEYASTRATNVSINGGLGEALRFLGQIRPTRLLARARACFDEGVGDAQHFRGKARVSSIINSANNEEVFDISTTTRTFIAEGILVHNCLEPNDSHSLAYMASRDTREPYWKDEGKGQGKGIPQDLHQFWTYNAKDAAVTRELYDVYKARLEEKGKLDFYKKSYRALYQPVLSMSVRGMRMDEERRQHAFDTYTAICTDLKAKLKERAGEAIYGAKGSLSPAKLQRFLYDTLGLKEQLKKDKKTGLMKRTSDEVAVRSIQRRYGHKPDIVQVCQWILDHKRFDKLRQFVSEKIADADGRMRSSYSFSPVTGRFSSGKNACDTGANAQNQDREIRDIYLPDRGHLFLEADLSQAESRIVFMLTGDKELVTLARTPPWEYDVHTANAARLYKIAESEVTKTQRYLGKRAVHAGHYGMQGKKLSDVFLLDGYAVPADEAQKLIDNYLEWRSPIVDVFQKDTRLKIIRDKALRNVWGRTVSFAYERMGDDLFRLGYAWVPQSTVPDIINRWGLVPLIKAKLPARLHLQCHDSLLVSVRPENVWTVMQFLKDKLERALPYTTPLGKKQRELTIPVEFSLSVRWKSPRAAMEGDVIEWKKPPTRKEVEDAARQLEGRLIH